MIETFGEPHACRMFRKIAPWYARRFGPAIEFNRRIVHVSSRAQFDEVLVHYRHWRAQFLDDAGQLKPRFQPAPLVASFLAGAESVSPPQIPVPRGPVEVW
jgi:tRNA-dihydrouridine synthase B